jgi:hypothetical protein
MMYLLGHYLHVIAYSIKFSRAASLNLDTNQLRIHSKRQVKYTGMHPPHGLH